MNTAEPFREFASGGGIVDMPRSECLSLLTAKSVGRIAYDSNDAPRILPLNYVLIDDAIYFRTVADGEIARYALDRTCSFEIDDIDEFFQAGWSVLAVGVPQPLTAAELEHLESEQLPQTWAGGPRTCSSACRSSNSAGGG